MYKWRGMTKLEESGGKLEEDVNTGRDVITRKIRDSGRCSQV